MKNKVVQALSLARRAGKLEIGFDATEKAVKKKCAKIIVVTDDIAERTLKNTILAAGDAVDIIQLSFESGAFEQVFRRRFVVAAVTDKGMAELVRKSAGTED